MKQDKKEKIIGFRPTPYLCFELDNICRLLLIKKSVLLRLLVEDFIERYYRNNE